MMLQRRVVCSFRDEAALRHAVDALAAAGFSDTAITVIEPAGAGQASAKTAALPRHYAHQLARRLEQGNRLLFVRVLGPDEEKLATMTLLEHSDCSVQVHDLSGG